MAGVDLSGLEDFRASDFIEPGAFVPPNVGGPLYVEIDLIDEDPKQPRHEFDEKTLRELADSITFVLPSGKPRGIISPISLRKNGDRYIVNHGARRLRAAKLAGLKKVPAFIDKEHHRADQVIENIQRDNLTALEIARYITDQIEAGRKKRLIAEELGKAPSFVTRHSVFFDFPDCIRSLYDTGKCTNIQLLYELYQLFKKHPNTVEIFCLEESNEFTKHSISSFISGVKERDTREVKERDPILATNDKPTSGSLGVPSANKDPDVNKTEGNQAAKSRRTASHSTKTIIVVSVSGVQGHLVADRPGSGGSVWVTLDGADEEVPVSSVQLVAVIEE